MSEPNEQSLSVAAVSHIERVLVEENLSLRKRLKLMAEEMHEVRLQKREEVARSEEMGRLRTALASVTWAETLEEAQGIAQGALSPYRQE